MVIRNDTPADCGVVITEVNTDTLSQAGYIHGEAWRASHRHFCSEAFVAKHTAEAQTAYLREEKGKGKRVFLLTDGKPVGIVSVCGGYIENLYVLPWEQNKGYGTRLLDFAIGECGGRARLWVLSNNPGAHRLYARRGFAATGKRKALSGGLYELEMELCELDPP